MSAKELGSLGAMAMELALRVPMIALELHEGLEEIAKRIEATSKAEMGVYQDAVGPFQGWAELAEATKDERVAQGYTENDPLRRSGETAETISHQTEGLTAEIGSPDQKMAWFEFGTDKMPARPVLGPAAFHNKAIIQKLVGAAAMSGLIGRDRIHEALGYDFKTID
jgi:hypothetical protein